MQTLFYGLMFCLIAVLWIGFLIVGGMTMATALTFTAQMLSNAWYNLVALLYGGLLALKG